MSKKKDEDSIIVTYHLEDEGIKIAYVDAMQENVFNKLLKTLKTYNMSAYKDYIFKFVPELKLGKVLGNKVDKDTYEYELPCDELFKRVHGKLKVLYRINGNVITMLTIEPTDILHKCASRLLDTYKGVVITGPKDKFKVDLVLKTMGK